VQGRHRGFDQHARLQPQWRNLHDRAGHADRRRPQGGPEGETVRPRDGRQKKSGDGKKMITRAFGPIVLLAGLMAGASVEAHHATASVYDPGKLGEIEGKLASIRFVNPHGSIVVTVSNEDGTTTDWTFTTASTTALARQGISQ